MFLFVINACVCILRMFLVALKTEFTRFVLWFSTLVVVTFCNNLQDVHGISYGKRDCFLVQTWLCLCAVLY